MEKLNQALERGVENIYPNKKALKALLLKKKIKLYQGFDPSGENLHIGHLVGLLKLKQFQDLGHEVIFLVGDFTGMIGDPTDKLSVRKKLTRKETLRNSRNWKKQASKILNFSGSNPAKIIFNSTWLDKVSFKDLIDLTSNFTVQQMIERDFFQKRLKKNKPIHLNEFLYPVAQAIDSLNLDVDLEIGGNDQMFNMLAGRDLVKALKGKEKYVLTTKLLPDAKGEKMGKTANNALFLNSDPCQMFGAIMSFSDKLIIPGFELLTLSSFNKKLLEERLKKEPLEAKKDLAFEIVYLVHSKKEALKAKEEFEKVFQKRQNPSLLKTRRVKKGEQLIDLLVKSNIASSKAEAKRLIKQGGVDLDGKKITDCTYSINEKGEKTIRCGKYKFVKIKCD